MNVPVAAPARMEPAEASAVRAAMESVVAGPQWILGSAVEAFEAAWGAYVGRPGSHVVGVGNGTDALTLAFAALGLPPGSTVLVAGDEGGYAATAARLAGLVPHAYDTGELGPAVDDLEPALSSDVSAVVVTHLHGSAVTEVAAIADWCRAHGLLLVEDCAQAHGLRVAGAHVGLTGDAATFSFYPTKNLGAVGDAGAVVLRQEEAAERARMLRQYGWVERYRVGLPGGRNTRMDALQAAVLTSRLPFLDGRNERRRSIASRYAELAPLVAGPDSVHHHAVIFVPDRDRVARGLESVGVATAVHYPWLDTEMPGLRMARVALPRASQRRERKLSLPCFPEMTGAEVDHVVGALRDLALR